MQSQRSPIVAETVPAEQDATSEPETEPRYYAARPDLLMEKCRRLQNIPFVMVEVEARSEASKRRTQELEAEFRRAEKRGQRPHIELESTILNNPLIGGWPKIESEDESDPEYPLAATEEEWFAWKLRIDAKRAQKRYMTSLTREAGSKSPDKSQRQLVVTQSIGMSQVSLEAHAKGKENGRAQGYRSFQTIAPESQWNDKSIENAFQSTPVQRERPLAVDYAPTPETPPSQLASPPNARVHLCAAAPFSDDRTLSRSQKFRHEKSNQGSAPASQHPQSLNAHRLKEPSYVAYAVSSTSQPRTPVSTGPQLVQHARLLSPPGSSPMPLRNVDGWRRHTALAHQHSQQSSSHRSPSRQHSQQTVTQHSQGSACAASQSTTHYLYGSQEVRLPPPQLKRSNSFSQPLQQETVKLSETYMKELEEELERERRFFDLDKAVSGISQRPESRSLSQPAGAWDIGSFEEETEFRSQEAKLISSFVENDLGNPYMDEPYYAFDPRVHRYENPYDDY